MKAEREKILFIVPYPYDCAPSQRFRFEQYLASLEQEGYSWDISSFLDEKAWFRFYRKGHTFYKALTMVKGYWRRFTLLFQVRNYDHIYIHRECSPMGPPIYPWILKYILRKEFIFDFDDAIWLPNHSSSNKLFKFLKPPSNALKLMKWAKLNSCGNQFLKDKAEQYNPNCVIIPTTLDTRERHKRTSLNQNDIPIIGWTGSHSTIKYLKGLENVLKELRKEKAFRLRVISDANPEIDLDGFEFIRWNKNTEIEDLNAIDIGLMPLPDSEWTRGKCGLKALQYMALGIPPLLSPVGVNTEIVEEGVTGYFCSDPAEWFNKAKALLEDPELVRAIGDNTRRTVEERFSVEANRSKFILLFAKPKENEKNRTLR